MKRQTTRASLLGVIPFYQGISGKLPPKVSVASIPKWVLLRRKPETCRQNLLLPAANGCAYACISLQLLQGSRIFSFPPSITFYLSASLCRIKTESSWQGHLVNGIVSLHIPALEEQGLKEQVWYYPQTQMAHLVRVFQNLEEPSFTAQM